MSHGNIGVFFSQCRVNDAELKNYRKQRQWNLGLEDNKKLACSKLRFIARKEEIKFDIFFLLVNYVVFKRFLTLKSKTRCNDFVFKWFCVNFKREYWRVSRQLSRNLEFGINNKFRLKPEQ